MSSPAIATTQPRNGDLFEFVNNSGSTKVTYYAIAPSPALTQESPRSLLQYVGPEGHWTLIGSQVTLRENALGQLLSVILRPQAGDGSLTFSLLIPPIIVDGNGSQKFTTYAVRARHADAFVSPGPQITYELECFNGEARRGRA